MMKMADTNKNDGPIGVNLVFAHWGTPDSSDVNDESTFDLTTTESQTPRSDRIDSDEIYAEPITARVT